MEPKGVSRYLSIEDICAAQNSARYIVNIIEALAYRLLQDGAEPARVFLGKRVWQYLTDNLEQLHDRVMRDGILHIMVDCNVYRLVIEVGGHPYIVAVDKSGDSVDYERGE